MADEEPAQNIAAETIQEEAEPAMDDAAPEAGTEPVPTDPPSQEGAAEKTEAEKEAEQASNEQEPPSEEATADAEQASAQAAAAEQASPGDDAQVTVQEGDEAPAADEQQAVQAEVEQTPDGEAGPEGEQQEATEAVTEQAEGGEAVEAGEGAAEGEAAPEAEGEQIEDTAPAAEEGNKTPLPQSDTFEEGTRAESPVAVGEKLSREGSPRVEEQQEKDERMASPPVPGTPDRDGSVQEADDEEEEEEEEEDEEYEDDEPQYDREQLISRYHQALTERHQLQDQNYQLQHKLAEHFRKKKADERQDIDKNVTDQEQRYLKYMANLDELRRQDAEEREMFQQQIEDMQQRCEERREHVNDERLKFMEFKKQIALNAVNSRSGKPIPPRDVEQYLVNESRKEEEVVKVRLENIKLKNKLRKKEMQLKSKEELAEGLHMIDFEQLKIENQTYNEKIEERNEELLKLRKKITSTVQVLTHLKEKLQFVQGENGVLNLKLHDVEQLAAKKRDILSRTKQARDALRIDNQRLRQNCGLLGNESLLRDFEERKDESDDLKYKLDQLKTKHAELTLNLNGVRRKIEQAKQGRM